jgi:hypothetical protein
VRDIQRKKGVGPSDLAGAFGGSFPGPDGPRLPTVGGPIGPDGAALGALEWRSVSHALHCSPQHLLPRHSRATILSCHTHASRYTPRLRRRHRGTHCGRLIGSIGRQSGPPEPLGRRMKFNSRILGPLVLAILLLMVFPECLLLLPLAKFGYLWWITVVLTTAAIAVFSALFFHSVLGIRDLIGEWRQSRRRAKNLCARCGYDLRASSERCPECGRSFGKEGC